MASRRTVRRTLTACATLIVLVAGVVGWVMVSPSAQDARENEDSYDVVQVERRDLSVGATLPGRFGYGPERPVPIRASGTVTWLPPAGTRAAVGDLIVKVDDRPVVLMFGRTPAYRALNDGSPATQPEDGTGDGETSQEPETSGEPSGNDPVPRTPSRAPSVGPDVEQLESGLAALGFSGFTVDREFTAGTAAAVREWQESLGVAPTGQVELGDVVFLPGPVTLHPDANALGGPVTDTSVLQTGTTKSVTVESEAVDWAERGVKVRVTLPNQRVVTGIVAAVARGGTDGQVGGAGTRQVRIDLAKPQPKVRPGPVTVAYVSAERRNVLAVPVTALVALAEGGYAVEAEDGSLVPVSPGLYAEGLVEVTGVLDKGTSIRVPR